MTKFVIAETKSFCCFAILNESGVDKYLGFQNETEVETNGRTSSD